MGENELPLPVLPADASSTSREFLAFCTAEIERRRSTEPSFDRQRFHRAVDFVLRRLAADKLEGRS